jgi:hypothetical protein
VLIVSFFLIESRSKAPLLPLRIFRLRTLAGSNLNAPDHERLRLLTILPAHAVHAAGPPTQRSRPGRLHRADADDHRLLGSLTGLVTRLGVKVLPVGLALSAVALVLYAQVPVHGHFPQSVPRLHHQRPRAGLRLHTDVDRRTPESARPDAGSRQG